MAVVRYGSLSDIHFPYEDKARYAVALKIFQAMKISRLHLNGDIGEFQGVSAWPMHPTEKINFCTELAYLNKKFDELQEMFPDIPVTYISGNHENRLFRYIRDISPAMWGVVDCPSLLKFPERPLWKFVEYGPSQLVRCGKANLWMRHEPLGGGAAHAKSTAEKSYTDILYGHTHVFQSYTHKKFGPKPFTNTAYSLGWLGDRTRHCFDYRGAKDNWTTGCTIIECDEATGQYTLEFICLDKLPVLYRGVSYNAR